MKYPLNRPINVLSLGAGVQSSALMLLYHTRQLKDKIDFAVFADTQCEPADVYEWLDKMKTRASSIPIIITTYGNLLEDEKRHAQGFTTVPLYYEDAEGNQGMGRRQCTGTYKIQAVYKAIRQELGYAKGKWMRHKVNCFMGISMDEMQRMKESQEKWVTNKFPLIEEIEWSRQDCIDYMKDTYWGEPPRSACYICPYRTHKEWKEMKEKDPESFKKACDWDDKMRDLKPDSKNYVYRGFTPLKEATFDEPVDDQIAFSFMDECDGMCGV